MSGAVMKMVGGKVAKKQIQKHFSSEDLYFDKIETVNRKGKVTIKKVKKPLPEGLTREEAAILQKVKKRAWSLDMALFNLLGTRFGWSAVVGLAPGIGDVLDGVLALELYRQIRKIEPPLSKVQEGQMMVNIVIDVLIGIIPLLGDYMDGIYKCNSRNVAILEKELIRRVQARSRSYADENGLHMNEQAGRHGASNGQHMIEQNERHGAGGPPPSYEAHGDPRHRRIEGGGQAPRSTSQRRWWDRREQEVEETDEAAPPRPPRKNTEMSQRT